MPKQFEITAELRNWHTSHGGQLVWGDCYGDIKGRFREGVRIHTSFVKEMRDCGDHFLCITLNSAYKLMKDQRAEVSNKRTKRFSEGV